MDREPSTLGQPNPGHALRTWRSTHPQGNPPQSRNPCPGAGHSTARPPQPAGWAAGVAVEDDVGPPSSRLVVARFWSWLPQAHHFLADTLRLVGRFEIRPWLVNDAVHSRSTDTGQSDGGSIDFSIC